MSNLNLMCWAATQQLHIAKYQCTAKWKNIYVYKLSCYMSCTGTVVLENPSQSKLKAEILLCKKGSQQFFLISTYAVIVLDKMTFFSKLISNRMNHTAFLVLLGSWCFKHVLKIKFQRTWPCEILIYTYEILLCHHTFLWRIRTRNKTSPNVWFYY